MGLFYGVNTIIIMLAMIIPWAVMPDSVSFGVVVTKTITSSYAGSHHPAGKSLHGILNDIWFGIILTQLLCTFAQRLHHLCLQE